MKNALEIAIYKTREDVAESDFLAASAEMQENFLNKQRGFIKRTFGKSETGEWTDVVYWETMNAAITASELAMKSSVCVPMFGMLDGSSVKMYHFEIVGQ